MPEEPSCILCNSNFSLTIYRNIEDYRHDVEGHFCIVQCVNCGMVYTSPRPTRDEMDAFYPSDYGAHLDFDDQGSIAKIRSAAMRARWGQDISNYSILARIIGHMTKNYSSLVPEYRKKGELLDIGCGNGRFLYDFQSTGWECWGIEVDEGASNVARKRGVNVKTGSFDDVSFPESSFDVVRLNHVLEHSHDPLGWLRRIHRLLREDGEVIVGVPDYNSLTRRAFGKYACCLDIPRHLYHFDKKTIGKLLVKAGFHVTKTRYNSFHSDYPFTSVYNVFRHKLGLRTRVMPNIYMTPVPLISAILDLFHMGDNLEIVGAKVSENRHHISRFP